MKTNGNEEGGKKRVLSRKVGRIRYIKISVDCDRAVSYTHLDVYKRQLLTV